MQDDPKEAATEDSPTGVNFATQLLHCLIVLHDDIGAAMSNKAGKAYFRAFVVEDRKTGEILFNQRFRYEDRDSWQRAGLGKEKQHLSRKEKIEYLAGAVERVMRQAVELLAGGEKPPSGAVVRFYPPEPEDAQKTMDWLIAQDLVEPKKFYNKEGREVPVGKAAEA